MNQYCRYCAFCFEGDALYCSDHEKVLSENQYRAKNDCPDFVMSELGDARSGKQYQPMEKSSGNPGYEQIMMDFMRKGG